MKDLLRTADLTATDIETLLRLATRFVDAPRDRRDLLAGRTVVLYFAKPSTRTRERFEVRERFEPRADDAPERQASEPAPHTARRWNFVETESG